MEDTVRSAIDDVTQAKDHLVRVFANTPDDRVAWSPSPTSRTPAQLVAHSAYALGFIAEMLGGSPYPAKTMAEADAEFFEMERAFTTREAALELLEDRFQSHVAFLGSVTADKLDDVVRLPFGLGEAPLRAVLSVGALHTRSHISQPEYLQTVYGDRVW